MNEVKIPVQYNQFNGLKEITLQKELTFIENKNINISISTIYTFSPKFVYYRIPYFNEFYKGYGKIEGDTYEKSIDKVIESQITIKSNNFNKIVNTNNGHFIINQLNENLTYDVYAKPLNGTYDTKIASTITPIHDVNSYNMNNYISIPDILYKNITNKLIIYTKENVGDLSYTLENSPIGVSILDNNITILSNTDSLSFSVKVTDSIGQENILDVDVNLVDNQIIKLPLEKDIIDINGNSTWQHYGTNDFINGWMRTTGNNHIYSNDIKRFEKDFSVSFNMVIYDTTKKNTAYTSVFSSGELNSTVGSHIGWHGTYGSDSNLYTLFSYLKQNDSQFRSNYRVSEYRNLYIKLFRKNNIEYIQINNFIYNTVSYSFSISDSVMPFRIGTEMWNDTNTSGLKGNFVGLIKNFTFSNGYVYDEIPTFDIQTIYQIDFTNNMTNYYELIIKNQITDVSSGYQLNGASSYIQLNGNTVNQFNLPNNQTLTIEFTPTNDTFILLDETISGGGFDIRFESGILKYIKSDGTLYATNLTLNFNVKNILKIQKENNLLLINFNNNKLYNQPMFRLGNIPQINIGANINTTNSGFMNGIIHKFRVTDFLE